MDFIASDEEEEEEELRSGHVALVHSEEEEEEEEEEADADADAIWKDAEVARTVREIEAARVVFKEDATPDDEELPTVMRRGVVPYRVVLGNDVSGRMRVSALETGVHAVFGAALPNAGSGGLNQYNWFVRAFGAITALSSPVTIHLPTQLQTGGTTLEVRFTGGRIEALPLFDGATTRFTEPWLPWGSRVARQTYSAPIFADASVCLKDAQKNVMAEVRVRDVGVGAFPVMVGSSLCALRSCDWKTAMEAGVGPLAVNGRFYLSGDRIGGVRYHGAKHEQACNVETYTPAVPAGASPGSSTGTVFSYVPGLPPSPFSVATLSFGGRDVSVVAQHACFGGDGLPVTLLLRAMGAETDLAVYTLVFGSRVRLQDVNRIKLSFAEEARMVAATRPGATPAQAAAAFDAAMAIDRYGDLRAMSRRLPAGTSVWDVPGCVFGTRCELALEVLGIQRGASQAAAAASLVANAVMIGSAVIQTEPVAPTRKEALRRAVETLRRFVLPHAGSTVCAHDRIVAEDGRATGFAAACGVSEDIPASVRVGQLRVPLPHHDFGGTWRAAVEAMGGGTIEDVPLAPDVRVALLTKAALVGNMVRRLLRVHFDGAPPTSRDNLGNIRAQSMGMLAADAYRHTFLPAAVRCMADNMGATAVFGANRAKLPAVRIAVALGNAARSPGSTEATAAEGIVRALLLGVLDAQNIRRCFNRFTDALQSNSWPPRMGHANEEVKGLIVPADPQNLDAEERQAARITKSGAAATKGAANARLISESREGMMCPVESPDGGNIGLTNHLSKGALASAPGSMADVMDVIAASGVRLAPPWACSAPSPRDAWRVVVNGDIVGHVADETAALALLAQLRAARTTGYLRFDTEIGATRVADPLFGVPVARDAAIPDNGVFVQTDGGRLMRLLGTLQAAGEMDTTACFPHFRRAFAMTKWLQAAARRWTVACWQPLPRHIVAPTAEAATREFVALGCGVGRPRDWVPATSGEGCVIADRSAIAEMRCALSDLLFAGVMEFVGAKCITRVCLRHVLGATAHPDHTHWSPFTGKGGRACQLALWPSQQLARWQYKTMQSVQVPSNEVLYVGPYQYNLNMKTLHASYATRELITTRELVPGLRTTASTTEIAARTAALNKALASAALRLRLDPDTVLRRSEQRVLRLANEADDGIFGPEAMPVRGFASIGTSCVVAISTAPQSNIEDALALNAASVQRGLFRLEQRATVAVDLDGVTQTLGLPASRVHDPRVAAEFRALCEEHGLDEGDGCLAPGDRVKRGGVIALVVECRQQAVGPSGFGFGAALPCKWTFRKLKTTIGGMVQRVMRVRVDDGCASTLFLTVVKHSRPVPGDKFSTQFGQKGVISEVIDQSSMPYCTANGITADVIISPLGFTTRMLMAQLIAMAACKRAAMDAVWVDAGCFTVREEHPSLFGQAVMVEESYVGVTCGRTGATMAPITMGLITIVPMKYLSRNVGTVHGDGVLSAETHSSGNRIGVMETGLYTGAGCSAIVSNLLLERSVYSAVPYCPRCGSTQVSISPGGEIQCSNLAVCGVANQFGFDVARLPFNSAKMMQLQAAYGIDTQFMSPSFDDE